MEPYNVYKFPDTLQGFVDLGLGAKCNSSVATQACSNTLHGYSVRGRGDDYLSFVLYYCDEPGTHCNVVYAKASLMSSDVISFTSQNGSTGPASSYSFSNSNPLFYGVAAISAEHVLLIPATILASLFFVMIYKMFKRVLFR